MYRKINLSILLLLFSFGIFGQEQENVALPNIIPPSPTAFELGRYGDIPINESTGMATINIPFFNYTVGDINLGISLDYTTSGIKVDQVASWVGMGWNLNAGGVITRTIRGYPDDLYETKYNNSFSGIKSLYDQNNDYYYSFLAKVNDAKERREDYEPDIYNFNVNGLSGTFVLDKNSEPLLLKRSNQAKIKKVINGFEITATNGLIFLFTTPEYNATRSTCSIGGASLADEAITAWYLSTITALNGDEVTLNYDENNYIYASGYNSTYRKVYPLGPRSCRGAVIPDSPGIENCVMYSYLKNKKITSITNNRNDIKIVFSHSNNRGDLPSSALKLDSIFLNNGEQLVKGFELNYQHITSNHNSNNILLTSSEYKNRMFLKSVKELSKRNLTEGGKIYTFEYNDPSDLPPRFSFAQDLLGFYNGQNSNYSLLPKTDNPWNTYLGYTYGNRSSDFTYASKGILTKVTYPTKGWTTLKYEPDVEIITDYSYQQSSFNFSTSTDVNNINIQQLTSLFDQEIRIEANVEIIDGVDTIHDRMLCTVTDLTTNQVVFDENCRVGLTIGDILLLKDHVYEFKIDLSPVIQDIVMGSISFTYYSSFFENELQNKTGIRVKRVKKKANENTNEEIKRYYYNNIGNYDQEPLISSKQYNFSETLNKGLKCIPVPFGIPALNYTLYTVSSGGWSPIYRLTNRLNKYRYVTVSYGGDNFEKGASEKQFSKIQNSINFDFGRRVINNSTTSNESLFNGTLIKETDFIKNESLFNEVRSVEYDYEIDPSKTKSVNGYIGRNKSPEYPYTYSDTNANIAELSFLQLNHYYVYSMFNKLKVKKTINYFDNGNLETNENFYYEGVNSLLLSRNETVNSKGDVLKTKTEYAQDVNDFTLINQNRISEPINVKTYKVDVVSNNEEKISEQNTIYNNFSGNYLPETIQISKGVNDLENRVTYHDYDNKGNPLEVSKTDGTHITYIWGYNQQYPVAKVENATQTEVGSFNLGDGGLSTIQANDLRASLPSAQVTTYTYDPLIGVTSITDPRGYTIYYEYDEFNRLKQVKDAEGNILSKNEYHYKN